MRFAALLLAFALTLSTPDARADDFTYLYVSGVDAFKKPLLLKGSNVQPWMSRELQKDEVYISNSCGFAKVTYRAAALSELPTVGEPDTLRPTTVYVHLGEWCRVAEFIFEHGYLLRARRYQDQLHLLSYAPVFEDSDRRLFVANIEFISENNLEALVENIPSAGASTGCYSKDYAELSGSIDREKLVAHGENYCYERGLYLNRLK